MGFFEDGETDNNVNQQAFEEELRSDPELKAELEHLEMALESIADDDEGAEEKVQEGSGESDVAKVQGQLVDDGANPYYPE